MPAAALAGRDHELHRNPNECVPVCLCLFERPFDGTSRAHSTLVTPSLVVPHTLVRLTTRRTVDHGGEKLQIHEES